MVGGLWAHKRLGTEHTIFTRGRSGQIMTAAAAAAVVVVVVVVVAVVEARWACCRMRSRYTVSQGSAGGAQRY